MASDDNVSKLKTAAQNNNLEEVKRLIETENVPVNSADMVGDTALHAATSSGKQEIVKYLLSKGADPNIRNNSGSTALHKAVIARYDQMSLTRKLLQSNADPNIRNEAGLLPEQLTRNPKIREILLGDQAVNEYVDIHKSLHGRIIGKAGSKISEIRETTGVEITIPPASENSNKVLVNGRREGVDKAKVMIQEVIASGKENDDVNDGRAFVKLPVPKDKHKFVIGRSGQTVNEIRDELGVEIIIPPSNSSDTNIIIKGDTSDDVDAAVKRILEITRSQAGQGNGAGARGGIGGVRRGSRDVVDDSRPSTKIPVPKDRHKHIIGRGGQTVNEIRNEFNVDIIIPPSDSNDTRIIVKGDNMDDIEAAVARIKEITERTSAPGSGAPGGRRDYYDDERRGSDEGMNIKIKSNNKGEKGGAAGGGGGKGKGKGTS